MGEVLSQNEIDSLLAALSSGELDVEDMQEKDEKQVKNYDFSRPAKFSKEHLRTLGMIFEHYGRLLSTNLPVYLRKSVQVSVASSETVTFAEFSNALSNPVLLTIVNFSPMQGSIIMDVEDMQEKDEKQVKNYDFSRPAKFSKEHLRTLGMIFEHYGRLLSTNLPVYLRKSVQVSVASSETVTFAEFSNALSNPVLLTIVNFSPMQGSIIMELTSGLGYAIIDRMLGGKGETLEKTREFSEIEMSIIERIMVICMQLLREPWKNVTEINPFLERIETNPQFAQIISPNDMVALVTMNIKIGDVEGLMNVCLPFFTLESVMDRLNTKFWYSNLQKMDEEDYEQFLEVMVRKVDVPVKAVLGKSVITVNDFVNIQVGDIIRLDSKVDDELDVYVGNIKKFTAVPGASKEAYAVRVTSVIREEE